MRRLENKNTPARVSISVLIIFTSTGTFGRAASGATYVGAAICAKCHAGEYREWSQARHAKMLQPATPSSVKGDFTRAPGQIAGFGLSSARERRRLSI